MFGGGGMNPRKMKQMMKQMGIDVTELDVDEVVIRTQEEDLVFEAPQVTRMDAQGQQTYQIVGDPESVGRGTAGAVEGEAGDASDEPAAADAAADEAEEAIPEGDVETVAQRASVGKSAAREALEAEDGDLAAAIMRLE